MKTRGGYTLVEVVVAMLLAAIMVTSVFSVALTGKAGGVKSDRRLVAAQAAKSLQQKLASYVCSDPSNALIAGPSAGPACAMGLCSWSLNVNGYTDSLGSASNPVYALAPAAAPNEHVITGPGIPPPEISAAAPYYGKVSYSVTWPTGCYTLPTSPIAATCQPQIKVSVNWSEP